MNIRDAKTIGIVGGMGPQAGSALFDSIIRHTKVSVDQQHLPVIMISFPANMIDRSIYLEKRSGNNPALGIVEIITRLENAGADVIGIACNTSHAPEIYNLVVEKLEMLKSKVVLVHMPFETCRFLHENFPQCKRIGLMTTNGTYHSGIYKNLLAGYGYEVIVPEFRFQNDVIHKMIYDPAFGLKANSKYATPEMLSLLEESLRFFEREKADAIVLGCTELSFALTEKVTRGMVIIDSTEALAKALIRESVHHSPGNYLKKNDSDSTRKYPERTY